MCIITDVSTEQLANYRGDTAEGKAELLGNISL